MRRCEDVGSGHPTTPEAAAAEVAAEVATAARRLRGHACRCMPCCPTGGPAAQLLSRIGAGLRGGGAGGLLCRGALSVGGGGGAGPMQQSAAQETAGVGGRARDALRAIFSAVAEARKAGAALPSAAEAGARRLGRCGARRRRQAAAGGAPPMASRGASPLHPVTPR
ncbi:hypothetical protein HYH03_011562 [Edaphochlamys debaryana]|uniref:Uncharacterized protein n=1 Tax=Edaphochlamys debaryana TaxID=47281 RepID=A0A836BUU1_9CHLO|nr:hypothetical protein HYH03_011562 [Edaphochlamys debaryana]|eukprot:KAG2489926.1 hypothetical protein HYH03_011562 [Edaphochlamys debaryana]